MNSLGLGLQSLTPSVNGVGQPPVGSLLQPRPIMLDSTQARFRPALPFHAWAALPFQGLQFGLSRLSPTTPLPSPQGTLPSLTNMSGLAYPLLKAGSI